MIYQVFFVLEMTKNFCFEQLYTKNIIVAVIIFFAEKFQNHKEHNTLFLFVLRFTFFNRNLGILIYFCERECFCFTHKTTMK